MSHTLGFPLVLTISIQEKTRKNKFELNTSQGFIDIYREKGDGRNDQNEMFLLPFRARVFLVPICCLISECWRVFLPTKGPKHRYRKATQKQLKG